MLGIYIHIPFCVKKCGYCDFCSFAGQGGTRMSAYGEELCRRLMATKPELAMQLAVKGMLPHNKLGAKSITRLKVYAGAEHNQQAQKPVVID